MKAGHFGLVVGSTAVATTWPTTVAGWLRWRDGDGRSARGASSGSRRTSSRRTASAARSTGSAPAPQLALGAGIGAAQAFAGAAFGASRTIRKIVGETAGQLDQLNRLGRVSARTRISFGLLLDEQAERAPDDVVLLFEDRAHTQAAVKERVDNVVRGLIEIGGAPGRARRRADADPPERADGRRGAEPARRGSRC